MGLLSANPHLVDPFMDATEIEVTGRDKGRIVLANGYSSHGEPSRTRSKAGIVTDIWLAGANVKRKRPPR